MSEPVEITRDELIAQRAEARARADRAEQERDEVRRERDELQMQQHIEERPTRRELRLLRHDHADLTAQLAAAQGALTAATAENERMRAVTEYIKHDIMVVTQHRKKRQSGGQRVGTGGPLSAANPSVLVYLERVVRDIAAAGRGSEGK